MNADMILFDIGNVLVKLTGASIIQQNSRKELSANYIREAWPDIEGVQDFESGRCDSEAFAEQVISFYDLNLSSEKFLTVFRSAAESKFEGVDEFLERLSQNYKLACLTNTNPIQWPKIRNEFGLGKYFEKQYVSYEMGYVKPEEKIFRHVLRDTGLESEEILFVDDNLENIEAARVLGFQCCHAVGFEEVRAKVGELGGIIA